MIKFKHFMALALMPVATPAFATSTPADVLNSLHAQAATPASRALVVRVDEALNALRYTYYVFGGESFDALRGVYKVDCTGYLNRMVEDASPTAYDQLRAVRRTSRPLAEDYYYLFASLPTDGSTQHGWRRVGRVADLRPGDVIAYRYTDSTTGSTGHAMVVVGLPQPATGFTSAYRIRVSDAAKSGHSSDNRGASGSGVGAGTILLGADPTTGRPTRFAWTLKGYWQSGLRIALGRPVG